MKLVYHPDFLLHESSIGHPENPGRLGLVLDEGYDFVEPCKDGEKCLGLVHDRDYVNTVRILSSQGVSLDMDTYTCRKSYRVACLAVGAAIKAADVDGFALLRPPGHHAPYGGFCLFNNMAIVARYLAKKGKRVMIFDWDLHHGNGTQDLVKGEEDILYFSTHQSPCYPGTGLESEGNAINIPLAPGSGDGEYVRAVEDRLASALERFQPDVVGVSAGFDSYYKDIGWVGGASLNLTTRSYELILDLIKEYRVFFLLEGGYNPESVADGVRCVTQYI
jgi:acetoin utilization deacetylase AcuC-like enzyme